MYALNDSEDLHEIQNHPRLSIIYISHCKSKRDQQDHTICFYILEKQDDKATFTAAGARSQKIATLRIAVI